MFHGSRAGFGALAKTAFVLGLAALFGLSSVTAADAARHRKKRSVRAPAAYMSPTDPSKDAALIIDARNGRVIYSRNAGTARHPASLTKMMTLYMLFEAMRDGRVTNDTPIYVSEFAAQQNPTKLNVRPGDTIPAGVAIKALVVRSANDVAVAIAEHLGGTEAQFAQMMTAKARQIGMYNTRFVNASGLPNNGQISTATDLSILARHLMSDFPQYYPYFSTPGFSYRGVNYTTHNNLLGRYKGTDGIKTGYTGGSGFNLVSSVERGNTHLVGVVLGGRSANRRDAEMMRLLDNAFAEVNGTALVAQNEAPWQSVAATNSKPVVAGFEIAPPLARTKAALAALAPVPAAPKLRQIAEKVARPTPRPTYALAKAKPQAKPQMPVLVAALAKTSKPALRQEIGEGDFGDVVVPTRAIRSGGQDWAIQIGAFANANMAKAQLANYVEQSMDVLGHADRIVVPFQSIDGQKLFRARFGGFAEREARQVCTRLTQRGQTCFATAIR